MSRYAKKIKKTSKNKHVNFRNKKQKINTRANNENAQNEKIEKRRKVSVKGRRLRLCKCHSISKAKGPSTDVDAPDNVHKKGSSIDVDSPNNPPKGGT